MQLTKYERMVLKMTLHTERRAGEITEPRCDTLCDWLDSLDTSSSPAPAVKLEPRPTGSTMGLQSR